MNFNWPLLDKGISKIEIQWWIFEGLTRHGKKVLPDGPDRLPYFNGSSKTLKMGFNFLHIFETLESSRYENLCQIFVHKILWVFLNTADLSCTSFSFLSFFLVLKLKQIAYGWKSRTLSILFLSNLRNWIKIEIVNEIKKLSVYLTFFMFANQNYFRN